MSEATGLRAGVCPHSHEPVTICEICLMRRADKGRLARETAKEGDGKGHTRGPASILEPPSPSQGVSRPPLNAAWRLRSRARHKSGSRRAGHTEKSP